MIKKSKAIEIDEIHFYNTFEHIWFKHVFGPKNYEFWGCGFNKSYSFLCNKEHDSIIYMI